MGAAMIDRPGSNREDPRGANPLYTQPVFFGPWIGEFGHEVMAVGPMRFQSRMYPRVIACSRPGSAALYADFADEFIAHDMDCVGMCAGATSGTHPKHEELMRWVPPEAERKPPMEYRASHDAEWFRYGTARSEYEDALVIHARWRQRHHTERNWPPGLWNRLARTLFRRGLADRLICIGQSGSALAVEGALDMRDAPLEQQMDVLASARFAMGPSSGPLHLAQHCGCPVLVWCGGGKQERHETQSRYERGWNPHAVPTHAHRYASWQPGFDTVWGWTQDFMDYLSQ